jgi:hypothetical protein
LFALGSGINIILTNNFKTFNTCLLFGAIWNFQINLKEKAFFTEFCANVEMLQLGDEKTKWSSIV